MPLTESEQAQYNAMVDALTKEQVKNHNLEIRIKNLRDKLNRIWDIIDEEEV